MSKLVDATQDALTAMSTVIRCIDNPSATTPKELAAGLELLTRVTDRLAWAAQGLAVRLRQTVNGDNPTANEVAAEHADVMSSHLTRAQHQVIDARSAIAEATSAAADLARSRKCAGLTF
ncbi:hypothetical protein [Kutzneria buriramensis]|uniref:Uncharacterized protein n=1 Tax=Kutzneria buriramensis TaxID=1045776 RepID=A0A3E0GTF0_9PSEU|nr:hypothetical protein [Kutzneria buriramensis]REH26004.1 hypothetical protein BCF44_13543 [Kutzneria buriramensis]